MKDHHIKGENKLYALILPIFGLTQATLLIGNSHWLIQLAPMLVGIGAIGSWG